MRWRFVSVAALAVSSIGLATSLASLVAYFDPTFCSASGCATVRSSAWSHPLGVPMPVFGIAFFGAMTVLAFLERPRVRRHFALAGASCAVGLILLQAFTIHAWCTLCLIADQAAILLAIAAMFPGRAVPLRLAIPTLPAIAALLLVLRWFTHASITMPPGTPEVVARAQVAGQVTVVDFVDFECPFCRKLHPELTSAISAAQVPVRVIRKMTPLPQHQHAMAAAIAWCCADEQGKGAAMADALFAAEASELTSEGCEQLAVRVGCDLDRYRRHHPAMADRVAADLREARAANVHVLPTVFIGTTALVGASHDRQEVARLLARSVL
jgi:uncharacterized membrane protein/predicted DsbA family dithiol-disulfide isomerase